MSDKKEDKKRKHADFQDEYHKSSNFPSAREKESEKLKVVGNGELKVKDSKKDKS